MENENTNTNSKPKLQEAGALWKRVSKSGNTYLNGTVKGSDGSEIKVIVYSNTYKQEGSNQPDYRVYLDTPLQNATTQKPAAPKKVAAKASSDEIPF